MPLSPQLSALLIELLCLDLNTTLGLYLWYSLSDGSVSVAHDLCSYGVFILSVSVLHLLYILCLSY